MPVTRDPSRACWLSSTGGQYSLSIMAQYRLSLVACTPSQFAGRRNPQPSPPKSIFSTMAMPVRTRKDRSVRSILRGLDRGNPRHSSQGDGGRLPGHRLVRATDDPTSRLEAFLRAGFWPDSNHQTAPQKGWPAGGRGQTTFTAEDPMPSFLVSVQRPAAIPGTWSHPDLLPIHMQIAA
jgi:hypothetical protein